MTPHILRYQRSRELMGETDGARISFQWTPHVWTSIQPLTIL